MSFKNKNLSVLAYANGFTLWHYVATEQETIKNIEDNSEYFGAVHCLMNVGDIIIINTDSESGIRAIEVVGDNFVQIGGLK